MASYGKRSKTNLEGLHPDMVLICTRVLTKYGYDHSIIEGCRLAKTQFEYFQKGREKKGDEWIVVDQSKVITTLDGYKKISNHQKKDDSYGHAIDAYPYPIDLKNTLLAQARFYVFAGFMFAACAELLSEGKITHSLRWGGDWDRDWDFKDQNFNDLPHYELRKIV